VNSEQFRVVDNTTVNKIGGPRWKLGFEGNLAVVPGGGKKGNKGEKDWARLHVGAKTLSYTASGWGKRQ